MSSLTSKRNVILLSLIAGVICLVASGRTWVEGSLNDGVVASSRVAVSGNQAVPGYFGIALVTVAGVLAAATSGRITRWIAVGASLVASVALVAVTFGVLLDPENAVKSRMTSVTGHNGEALARGSLTIWFWLAMFGSLLAILASGLAVVGVRRWAGLSQRYEAPGDEKAPRRQTSDWDLMTAGVDPTAEAAPESHEGDAPDTMTHSTTTNPAPRSTMRGESLIEEN